MFTAKDTVGKEYGDLAANIGPTSENPFTNTISNQSFNCSKESVFRQFRTWSCKLTLFSERGSGGQPPVKSEV